MIDEPENDFDRCIRGGWPETILAATGIQPALSDPSPQGVTEEMVEAAVVTFHGRKCASEIDRANMRRVLEQFAATPAPQVTGADARAFGDAIMGDRGEMVCTLNIAHLYRLYVQQATDGDAHAGAQAFCCEVEKAMGIYNDE